MSGNQQPWTPEHVLCTYEVWRLTSSPPAAMDSATVASASDASWHMLRHVCRLAAEAGAVLVLQLPPSMLDDASMLAVASMLLQPGWQSAAKLWTCFSSCSTKPCLWRSHCLHSSSWVATPAVRQRSRQSIGHFVNKPSLCIPWLQLLCQEQHSSS
jgi:hypothetical protein